MILCCGEALIDMLQCETADGGSVFAPHCGGGALNTAIALGRLGAPAGFLSGLSTDLFGTQIRSALLASNVSFAYAPASDRPSTLAFVQIRDGEARYAFFDENSAGRMLAETDLPALGPEVEALHFSGFALATEPSGSTFEALMARENSGRVLMLDPNIRPALIADRPRHLERMRRMIALADIVKLSDQDLAWFGERGEESEIASRWLAAGPSVVIVTHGANGASGYVRDFSTNVPACPVSVIDSVGAGDTFNAGLLTALREHGLLDKEALAALTPAQLHGAMSFAAGTAAITVSRAGANPPWRGELG